MSDDLRRQRHDLHEPLLAQLAPHRAEDARRPRLSRVGDEDGGVFIETDVGAVLALSLLRRPHDDRLGHLALLDLAGGDGRLDRDHDDVPEAAVAALGPAEHADHEGGARPRVIRDPDDRFLLNHARLPLPYRARSTISTTRHCLVFDSGRVSTMRTVWPALAPISSCAATCLVRSTCLPYSACAKRRTIATVTVFCILSFTTTPVRTLRLPLMRSSARAEWCGSARGRGGSCGSGADSPPPRSPSGTATGNARR